MKPFLKKFAQVGGIVALALVLGIGVSVFADNYVGAPAFPQNAPTPLNVTSDPQTKGDFQTSLGALLKIGGSAGIKNGLTVVENAQVGGLKVGIQGQPSSVGGAVGNIFGKLFVNNNTDDLSSGIKIGGNANGGALSSALRAALDIDLTGRTDAGGRDGLSIKSAVGQMASAFVTNSQVFHFYSDLISKDARLWAGSIKLSEYNPAAGKVLASGDSNGNAVWSTFNPGSMDVKYVSVVDHDSGNPRVNKAYCPSGYVAIGGGGDCEHGDIRNSRPIKGSPNGGDWTWATMPETNTDTGAGTPAGIQANGWFINCGDDSHDGDIHVDVICLKAAAPSFTVPTPTSVTSVGGGTTSDPNPTTWKNTTGQGNWGETCNAWLSRTSQVSVNGANPQTVMDMAVPSAPSSNWVTDGNRCMYESTGDICTSNVPSVSSPTSRPVTSCSINMGRYGYTKTYR